MDEKVKPTLQEQESPEEAELNEVLESIPQEQRKAIEQFMISSSVHMRQVISPETEVMKKITPEHVSEYLAASREEMQKSYQDKNSQRWFMLAASLMAMVFVVIVILLLRTNPDIMEKVIYAGGGLIAGSFGGYGIGKNKRDD